MQMLLANVFLYLICGILSLNVCIAIADDDQLSNNYFLQLTILTKSTNEQTVEWEHYAVMRSLKAGLDALGITYNYNPSSIRSIHDVVLVPCGKAALSQARLLKRDGQIKKLIVGPNFYPHEVNFPEVDIYLVPSASVIQFAQDICPAIVSRCRVSYAGVNHVYWCQQGEQHKFSKNVLVYWKTESEQFCCDVETMLMQHGWIPHRIHYGSYTQEQYKELLTQCSFAVFISRSESQGLALAEAWSMDVPTFCWNPMNATVFGHIYTCLSACPYLNDQVGASWKSWQEFELLLQSVDELLPVFTPRAWVLGHMTDAIAAQVLVAIIQDSLVNE